MQRKSALLHRFRANKKIKQSVKLTQPAPLRGWLSHLMGQVESILNKEGKLSIFCWCFVLLIIFIFEVKLKKLSKDYH
jgi:hypothetical protein